MTVASSASSLAIRRRAVRSSADFDAGIPGQLPAVDLVLVHPPEHRRWGDTQPGSHLPSPPARPDLLNDHCRQPRRMRTRKDFFPEEGAILPRPVDLAGAAEEAQALTRVFHWSARVFYWCDGSPESRL